MKRKISIFFALIVISTLVFPMSISAKTTGKCGPKLKWSIDYPTGTLTITGTGPMDDFTVDYGSSDNSDTVPWYDDRTSNIEKVVIAEGVTSIGKDAFRGCEVMKSCIIPSSVKVIGDHAFEDCDSLANVTIPDGVTTIGDKAFWWCENLTKLVIPSSVKTIGEYAFELCENLTTVTMKSGVISIGKGAFAHCNGLTNINIPNSVTKIGKEAFEGCDNLTSVTIPGSVQTISENAFLRCRKLNTVTIGKGVQKIGKQAFSACYKLANIDLPNSVTTIESQAFGGCVSVNVPASATTIAADAFKDEFGHCKVNVAKGHPSYSSQNGVLFNKNKTVLYTCPNISGHYTIPNTVIEIKPFAFSMCYNMTSITISNSVKVIGEHAFSNSGLTSVVMPNSVTQIGDSAFAFCEDLRNVTLSSSITKIEEATFSACKALKSITIPNGVTSIGSQAFQACDLLNSITIPDSVTFIANDTFAYSKKVTICSESDSYAQKYAKTNGIPFVASNHKHTYGEWKETKAATCTDKGMQKRACSVCQNSETRTIDALGHNWGSFAVVQEATLTTEGTLERKCKKCGASEQKKTPCAISDASTGVSIETAAGVFADSTELIIEKINDTTLNNTIKKSLEKITSKYIAYDIYAMQEGKAVQPNGEIELTFKIPSSFSKNIALYYVADNGETEKLDSVINDDNMITVKTTHFSYYVICDLNAPVSETTETSVDNITDGKDTLSDVENTEKNASETKKPLVVYVLVILAICAVVVIVVVIVLRKKNYNTQK